MPKISVIIPTCDRAGFVARAVKSVGAQSLRDLEIIVVDDGSRDNTAAVIDSLNEPGLVYLRHDQRLGGAAARNTGILHSTGEYVAFLDDDDEWYPEKLARQMDVMLASPPEVGGVYTGYFIVERSNAKIRGQVVPTERGDLYEALLAGNCIGGTSSVLLRRACFEEIGLFDERLPSFQDYDLWLRIARKFHFEYVREPMLKYFVHDDKIWTNSEALLQGLKLMLRKHGHSAAFRRKCSVYYLSLGVELCERNRLGAGRDALVSAARLNPLAIESYLYLGLALLGSENFRRARHAKARLLPRWQSRETETGLTENA
jgi:glycosyltransferase involved in cell wall biosynthesis